MCLHACAFYFFLLNFCEIVLSQLRQSRQVPYHPIGFIITASAPVCLAFLDVRFSSNSCSHIWTQRAILEFTSPETELPCALTAGGLTWKSAFDLSLTPGPSPERGGLMSTGAFIGAAVISRCEGPQRSAAFSLKSPDCLKCTGELPRFRWGCLRMDTA